jgi:hypothetical protein
LSFRLGQVSAKRLALSGLHLPCPVAACCLRELHRIVSKKVLSKKTPKGFAVKAG